MKQFLFLVNLIYILLLLDFTNCDTFFEKIQVKQMIDPNSFNFNFQREKVIIPQHDSSREGNNYSIEIRSESKQQKFYCKEDKPYEDFARRLINMLIKNCRLKIIDGKYTGSINLEATLDQLEILKDFGDGKISIRQFDGIITEVIKSPPVHLVDEVFTYTDMLCFYLYEHRRTFLSILFSMVIIPIVIKGTRTRLGMITLLLSIITIISFIMTWQQLLQDAEIKLAAQRSMYKKLPDECIKDDLGFFRSLKLFFGIGHGDCLKYYEAMMKDPMLEVTPTQAFIHMFSKSITYPLLILSQDFSQFIDNMSDTLPWWIKPIAKPLIFFITFSFMYSLVFIIVGGKFGIRVGPLFHFYIHGRDSGSSSPTSSINRQAIEIIQPETSTILNETHVETQVREISSSEDLSIVEEKSTKVEEIVQDEQKLEEIDRNDVSDEFTLDNDYEKISKKNIEIEMNRSEIEIVEGENLKKRKKIRKSITKNKRLLEIGTTDS